MKNFTAICIIHPLQVLILIICLNICAVNALKILLGYLRMHDKNDSKISSRIQCGGYLLFLIERTMDFQEAIQNADHI